MITINKAENTTQVYNIAELAKEIWTEYYTPLIGESQVTYMVEHFQSFEKINSEILANETIYYLAYYYDNPAGYCAIKIEEDGIFLSKLYVKEEFRKLGIGRCMLNHIIENSMGKSYVYLTVNKQNFSSISTYEKLGFKIIDACITDIGSGYVMDDYIMKRYL